VFFEQIEGLIHSLCYEDSDEYTARAFAGLVNKLIVSDSTGKEKGERPKLPGYAQWIAYLNGAAKESEDVYQQWRQARAQLRRPDPLRPAAYETIIEEVDWSETTNQIARKKSRHKSHS